MQIFRNGYDIVTVGKNLADFDTIEKLKTLDMAKPTVFTLGHFDQFNANHADFLYEANGLGARLIVGLFDDYPSTNFKFSCADRLAILLSNKYVDYVVVLEENDSVADLVEALRVDTFAVSEADAEHSFGLTPHVKKVEVIPNFKPDDCLPTKLRVINANFGLRKKGK